MKKGLVIAVILIILVGISLVYWQFSKNSAGQENNNGDNEPNQDLPNDGNDNEGEESNENIVEIVDFTFLPETLNIKKGDSVTWTNKDGTRHTATSDDGVFDSGPLSNGQSFKYQFNEVGTFSYHCTPHPYMKAKIIVE